MSGFRVRDARVKRSRCQGEGPFVLLSDFEDALAQPVSGQVQCQGPNQCGFGLFLLQHLVEIRELLFRDKSHGIGPHFELKRLDLSKKCLINTYK